MASTVAKTNPINEEIISTIDIFLNLKLKLMR